MDVKAKVFNEEDQKHTEAIKKANANPAFNRVIHLREVDGFTVDQEAIVREIESNNGEKDATFLVVTRVVKRNGQQVGEVVYLQTPDEETAYSTVKLNDTQTEILYFDNEGQAHQEILKNDDVQAQISKTECKALVAAICGAGMSTSIPVCAAGCTTFGPGMIICTPLCWGLAAVGCGYGASAACAWVD